MDVLGFENILKDLGLGALRAKYDRLIAYVREHGTGGHHFGDTPWGTLSFSWEDIGSAYFSDSVLFWTRQSDRSLWIFTMLIADAVCFGIDSGLPLRGAISVGELILDKESGTFLGEPLVEAARTEREQQWIGVSFGPSFARPPNNHGFFLKNSLPDKSHYKSVLSPCATGLVLDWPRRWRENRQTDVRPSIRELDRDPAFSEYYARTLAFVDFSDENRDWFTRQRNLGPG